MKRLFRIAIATSLFSIASVLALNGTAALARGGDSTSSPTSTENSPSSPTGDTSGRTGAPKPEDSTTHDTSTTDTSGKSTSDNPATKEHTANTEQEHKQPNITEQEHQGKLDDSRLQICKEHQTDARQNAANINRTLSTNLQLFTQVTARVDEFVTSHNLKVTNYSALKSAADAAGVKAAAALEAAKTTPEVNCDGTNPKAQAESNRALFKTAQAALKEYRTALKTLIAAVRAAVPTTSANHDTGAQQ